jgi:amino acid transporter
MQMSQMHYLPLAPGFFAILVGFFFIVLILRSVRYAYESLGVSSNAAIFLLFATLIGSFFNIPIAELSPYAAHPARPVAHSHHRDNALHARIDAAVGRIGCGSAARQSGARGVRSILSALGKRTRRIPPRT